jgi:ribosome-associated toxin RatA of RatAB toxin-antitoxin module
MRSGLFALALVAPVTAAAADLEELLGRGPLVLIQEKGGGFDTATGIVRVDADVTHVWNVLTDFASYRDFMPKVLKSEVLERSGTKVRVAFEIEVPGVNTSYEVQYTLNEPRRQIDVAWASGDLEGSRWSWRLEPSPSGNGTLVHYACSMKNFSSVVASLDDDQQTMTVGVNVGTVLAATKALKRRAEASNRAER